jgi:phosphatidylglycerol:prolipoprotein diacylglycerol transferase
MTFEQFGIHFGPFTVYGLPVDFMLRYYGIILVSGAFLGGYLASVEARRRGHNPDYVWDGLIWALAGGIVGARLWHILTPPPSMVERGITAMYYLTHPLEAINTQLGGLGIPGAVAGGMLGLYLYTRRMKLSFVEWADIAAPGLALGQAIGRWGNYVNQELYGAPTSLPWALTIEAPYRVPGFTEPALKFHPTFLYESIGNLLICLALLFIARSYAERLKQGDLFLVYLILYPVLRFSLEFVRLDSSQVLGLNANQTLMLVLIIASAGALLSRHRKPRRYELKARSAE